jgi:methylglutaconyl-CoA hydratase
MNYLKIIEHGMFCDVILQRPEVRNSFNPEMITEITKTFADLQSKKNLRAIVLRGEGKVFCAGADLAWMQSMANYNFEQNQEDAQKLFEMFNAIERINTPVLAMLQGAVFGGGLGLVAACDFVVAERNTQFCFSETKLGLVPAVISAFVKNKAFMGQVRPYMLSAMVFSASKAQEMGLVNEVSDDADSANKVIQQIVNHLCECGPEAVRATKALTRDVPSLHKEELKERTAKVIAERRVSTEGQEGLKAFLEKRTPSWRTKD